MRQISIKKGAQLEGNFYRPDQISGLSRFIKAAKYRGYSYDEVLGAWDKSYGLKCERKRTHLCLHRAVFSTSGRAGYTCVEKMTLAQRLKLATSLMSPHDIKLCYCAFIETAMEVYGISFGKEVAQCE